MRASPADSLANEGLGLALGRSDALKREFGRSSDVPSDYKEWFHFCVEVPGGHLIVNFSLVDRWGAKGGRSEGVLTILSTWPHWRGVVRRFPSDAVRAREGELDLQLGPHSLRLTGGVFEVSVDDERLGLSLRLTPRTWPTQSRLRLGGASSLEWVIVPQLEASGELTLGARSLRIATARAYHDHNWGRFRWSADLAWEWGFAIAENDAEPWTVVFSRLMDQGGRRTFSQGVLVWQGPSHVRTFHDREIRIARSGFHRQREALTLPPVGAFLMPGAASGVPARFELEAGGLGDDLTIAFSPESHARIVLPSDDNALQLTVVNEVVGRAQVRGHVGGRAFDFSSATIMEFVRAA